MQSICKTRQICRITKTIKQDYENYYDSHKCDLIIAK